MYDHDLVSPGKIRELRKLETTENLPKEQHAKPST